MLYSKSSEYAIQAMIYLAEQPGDRAIMVNKIAEENDIPKHFLAKLIQSLSKYKLVKSIRGRNGGIMLGKAPEDIIISNIIEAIDGPPSEEEACVIGMAMCSNTVACPVHEKWVNIRDDIRAMLSEENLAHLAKETILKKKILANPDYDIESDS